MLLSNLIEIVDTIAPPNLAMPDDPIGMHLGSPATKVERVLVCLDVTDKIARQAHDRDVDAIFCHHPLIYHPIQSLAEDNPANHLIAQLIRDRLAVYSLHTNWDAADDGLNHALARSVGLRETEPLDPTYGAISSSWWYSCHWIRWTGWRKRSEKPGLVISGSTRIAAFARRA